MDLEQCFIIFIGISFTRMFSILALNYLKRTRSYFTIILTLLSQFLNLRIQTLLINLEPIVLANIKHKILTNNLVDRLDILFPNIIYHDQIGFINGMKIRGGIYLVFESINLLNKKIFYGNMDLKFDISKDLRNI